MGQRPNCPAVFLNLSSFHLHRFSSRRPRSLRITLVPISVNLLGFESPYRNRASNAVITRGGLDRAFPRLIVGPYPGAIPAPQQSRHFFRCYWGAASLCRRTDRAPKATSGIGVQVLLYQLYPPLARTSTTAVPQHGSFDCLAFLGFLSSQGRVLARTPIASLDTGFSVAGLTSASPTLQRTSESYLGCLTSSAVGAPAESANILYFLRFTIHDIQSLFHSFVHSLHLHPL